jgi:predicted DNA-binding transcriptional regulator AlpA
METRPVRTTTRDTSEFVTAADLRERYHCSRMWIVRHIRHHNFPEPIKVGGNTSARRWPLSEVEQWEHERAQISGRAP